MNNILVRLHLEQRITFLIFALILLLWLLAGLFFTQQANTHTAAFTSSMTKISV